MNEIETWAIAYVSRLDPDFSSLEEGQKLTKNFFTTGHLDSMALMNMLLDAEMQFGFMFTPDAFQDRRIQTIRGLGEVINELRDVA